jgi:hypothetical protein
MSRVRTAVVSQGSYADFKRFFELVHRVRDQIRIGLVSEQAKADATELFHRAAHELTIKKKD